MRKQILEKVMSFILLSYFFYRIYQSSARISGGLQLCCNFQNSIKVIAYDIGYQSIVIVENSIACKKIILSMLQSFRIFTKQSEET